jgi:cytochrome b561
MRTERDGFSGLQRVLHWLMAIMVLAQLFIGVSMVTTLKPRYLTLISIPKPLGIAILALAVLRLGVRWRLGAPPLPDDLPRAQALAAKLSHVVLYALLIVMPLVGWGMLSAGGYPSCSMVLSIYLRFYLTTTSCTRSCERRIQCSPTCFSPPSCCTSRQRSSMA